MKTEPNLAPLINKIYPRQDTLVKEGVSRRHALKLMGLSPIAASVIASSTATEAKASNAKGKIVILGGGAGGIMAMAHLRKRLSNPDITIVAPNEVHIYQPGQIFIASGVYDPEDIKLDNNDFIPDDVKWIKDEAKSIDADTNTITLRSGEKLSYDFLVVATGMQYHYEKIKGLSIDDIGKNGISSVYLNDLEKGTYEGGEITWKWFNELKEAVQDGKKPKALFTQPDTPIKCGGAPQKILYLAADYLRQEGLSTQCTFCTNTSSLFSLPNVAKELSKTQKMYDDMSTKFNHVLIKVDVPNKTATFAHAYQEQGEWDEDFEMYETTDHYEEVTLEYDFLHVVPPMGPVDAVRDSSLGWQKGTAKGWLEVDRYTLQHRRYKNVFGIGDICGLPMGKTGGSARHHAPIVAKNLISQMQDNEIKEKFDGYTVCPLKTQYGKIIMAEFGYDGPLPSLPFWKDVSVPRSAWWIFDVYMLKPMYQHLMMRGLM
ncbi:NAD(P)/FAD-dependent oxidoreductase [Sulfurimonas sp. MAG313]|nr:FAD/NAD(P)-binding oxidoreductase [Sulfurimonas sp. MAG313]MDF1882024.1 NAD(P)/FAD-dependent oxidoreductase [Sulfurimonas sp. MAG313]